MLSTRWQPQTEISQLRNEMERLFGRFGAGSNGHSQASSFPALNMWEDDDVLTVEAELPGFELDNLEMYVTGGNQLSLKGERSQCEMGDGTWHRQERSFGKFSRLIELPHAVDSDKVEAEFSHGVLRVTLPKAEEAKPRRISVKVK